MCLLKELEDSPHFPNFLRNYQTDFIGFVVIRFKVYRPFVKYINTLSLSEHTMTDLCSGSGEPAIGIFRDSNYFNHLILSDKYPRQLLFSDDKINYLSQSMDILEMEFQSGICYTMFNAFHHFSNEDKLKIMKRIQKSGSRAFFVEILEPGIICLLKVLFITTIGNLLLTPWIRPLSVTRLIFTYLFPVNLFTITYDGIVSVFKSLSLKKYRKLFSTYDDSIKVFKLKNRLSPLIIIQIQPEI